MTTTPPDDVAAMFDLPAEPQPSASSADADEALAVAEAALAAEIAAEIEAGGVAADAPESRAGLRVEVSWPARMTLPDGRVVDVEVRNVSESGVGLRSGQDLPARTVVQLEMAVPSPGGRGAPMPVKGAIKTTYTVVQGAQILCGAAWQAPPIGAELVDTWIERLRG